LLDQNQRAAFNYIETLETYLDENMNAAKAAKRLYISRNSFLYRLNQILAVLKEDLRDPDARYRMNTYLRLLRQSAR
jgi:purine catabolism regulator